MRLRAFVLSAGLFVMACSAASFAYAQTVDFDKDRVPMTVLHGPWRFHAGDDASWANPAFDDSGWSLLNADKGWSEQGYAGYGGVAWYRLAIALPAHHGPLALYIPNVDVSCQVFANGRLIGQVGGLPPQPHLVSQSRILFAIPNDVAATGRLLLAIRIWEPANYATALPGGLYPAPRIGDAHDLARFRTLAGYELGWENSSQMVELFANFIGGLASLILFALRRKEREYLWFGIYLLNWSLYNVHQLYSAFRPVPYDASQVLTYLLLGLGYYAFVQFLAALCGQTRSWLRVAAEFLGIAGAFLLMVSVFQPQGHWGLGFYWVFTGYNACLFAIVYRSWRAGSGDAAILMFPVSWSLPNPVLHALGSLPAFGHQAWMQAYLHFYRSGIQWPFPYWVANLSGDLVNLVVLIVLIRRFARSRRDEERLESELEAARTVQKVLIPDEVPTIPGFRVQAVYKPASEVGGDFFQIIATKSGGALIAIGDVSGKGMPAAMTVSLLVGTFRTLAHYTQSPAEILRAMNQRMLTRSDGGFTTCLVLRADCDGNVTAANAGQLAPYLGGREVSVEYGLPLGLAADSRYVESRFHLKPGEPLTLLTDGVPEARNAEGRLFGFESTAAISTEPAEAIAEKAREFGQKDDVTVVKLTLEPARITKPAAQAMSAEPVL